MGRKTSRRHAFSIIYQLPFHKEFDARAAVDLYLAQTGEVSEEDGGFIFSLVDGASNRLPELDALITSHAVGWALDRIATVDLAIMRLAIFEMRYIDDVPVSVAINEAVELAKVYGGDDSASFINGLLAQVAKVES